MKKKVLSILVDNSAGVLIRVAGLFSRRGYNIDSLTVGETENSGFSRMTVVCHADDHIFQQMVRQLAKLEDVRYVKELTPGESVCRELILIIVRAKPEERPAVVALSEVFRAKVVDVDMNSMMIELTGNQQKLNAFIKLLDGYEIVEMVRTGIAGLSRGDESLIEEAIE